jgi:hypothetical protein
MGYIGNETEGDLRLPSAKIAVRGTYHGQLVRGGEVIDEFEDENLVVNEGLNALLDIMFHNASQISTWYLGVFKGNYTPVAGVTAASIAGDATETGSYDEASRPAFDEGAASGQSISNTSNRATFTFNASETIYGAFLISDATKSGTSGKLFSAARFNTPKSVDAGDQLLLAYTFSAASA